MKFLILGFGSAGQRHASTLRALRPEAEIVTADPRGHATHRDWRVALEIPGKIAGVLICSPHDAHLEQIEAANARGLPIFCEKPLCTTAQTADGLALAERVSVPFAMGFQYRFHWAFERVPFKFDLTFIGSDYLAYRYGLTVAETMASHAIDWALRSRGAATEVELRTDGMRLSGHITHATDCRSFFDYDMEADPRISRIRWLGGGLDLSSSDAAYIKELQTWLALLEGGVCDPRLATLADAVAVQKVMAQCKPY